MVVAIQEKAAVTYKKELKKANRQMSKTIMASKLVKK
jgi:hypothetical protein